MRLTDKGMGRLYLRDYNKWEPDAKVRILSASGAIINKDFDLADAKLREARYLMHDRGYVVHALHYLRRGRSKRLLKRYNRNLTVISALQERRLTDARRVAEETPTRMY